MVENQLIVDSYLVDGSLTKKPSTRKPSTKKPLTLLLVFFIAAAVAAVAVVAMVPTASAWDYSRNITINASQVPSEQTDFPVLLNLSGTWLKYKDHAGGHINTTDASDVVFTTNGEETGYNTIKLDWEREKYNNATGELVAWVRIPTLNKSGAGANTVIRMWYGHSDPPSWAGPNPTGVWDTNYTMVQHLNESCAASGCIKDSTSNGNDGTPYSDTTATDLYTASGKIDGADDLRGEANEDRLDFGNVAGSATITFEAWIYKEANTGWIRLLCWNDGTYIHQMGFPGIGVNKLAVWRRVGGSTTTVADTDAFPLNEWKHVVFVDNAGTLSIYIDGVKQGTEATTAFLAPTTEKLFIGAWLDGGGAEYFNGTVDEVRISDNARSGDWIKTSYNNQVDATPGAGNFITSDGKEITVPEGEAPIPDPSAGVLFASGLGMLVLLFWWGKRKRS